MKAKLICGAVIGLYLALSMAWADSLELKNGSLIKSTFMGGSESEITFQVGSSVQRYSLGDIVSLRFDSDPDDLQARPDGSPAGEPSAAEHPGVRATEYVTIPAGTRISVRTIDAIDSTKNHVGDRFQASLEEPLMVDWLAESKESGKFTGRSELRLELTGIVVDGPTVPVVTGDMNWPGNREVRAPPREPLAARQ